jgi:hypothetical protein
MATKPKSFKHMPASHALAIADAIDNSVSADKLGAPCDKRDRARALNLECEWHW